MGSSGMGRDVHSLMLSVHPAFPLPTTASPTLQGAPRDGFGEAALACDLRRKLPLEFVNSNKNTAGLCKLSLRTSK